MFYSHQLLARKAPLGQIWMAATLHAKINRRKLDKLNIIKICEEILNPSVPMALRLSGILMGGVVIVYERKVKLLYEDVNRLLVEINEAWKVKAAPALDPTVLPKGKSHAKRYEAVTLPDNEGTDIGDIEQSLNFSNTNPSMEFERTAYIAMRLDSVQEEYTNVNGNEDDAAQQFHQVDAADITLPERFNACQTDTAFNRFERFDIEDGTQLNFTSGGNSHIPNTLILSPPLQDETFQADEIPDQHPEQQVNQQVDESKEAPQPQQDQERQVPTRKRARKVSSAFLMDYEQTVIPGHIYQSWLQETSDIRRGRKIKNTNIMSSMKISKLMEIPPLALICGLVNASGKIHYPAPLLELWRKCDLPPQGSPSGRTSPPQPPEPSLSSFPERVNYHDPMGYPYEDFHSGVGSRLTSMEKQMPNIDNTFVPDETFVQMEDTIPKSTSVQLPQVNLLVTPGNSGDGLRSIHSSGSGYGFPSHRAEVNSGRSNKKRTSSARHGGDGLETVAEDIFLHPSESNFKLAKVSEHGFTPDHEFLVETGPTQTQYPCIDPTLDKVTDSIRTHLKTHFDAPGAPKFESLNNLTSGMNRKKAAQLFFQTCVLATREFVKVEQRDPYADIIISKGKKM